MTSSRKAHLDVVIFSGGRGSGALTTELVRHHDVRLTVAINGYDDGASTGEVRRFLGDCLGPSDFRKNASRLATELRTCPRELVELLDERFPRNTAREQAVQTLRRLSERLQEPHRSLIADRVDAFLCELDAQSRSFNFSDCSAGNLVFAGCFLRRDRRFNAANADYCSLVGLPPGLIENVTDGTNAYLVAVDADGRLLGSEEEIVAANRHNRIRDIHLIDRPISDAQHAALSAGGEGALAAFLREHERTVALNPALADRLAAADLIVYAPGTQHSSLFPSYLTPGLSAAIARNLHAIKLLVTNIQPDAEIPDASAVDLIERAVYYLKEKGRASIATPCLITHSLLNDPASQDVSRPYVPLGRLDAIEDPRLVRIGNYEDGVTGRHDALRILTPFVEALLGRHEPPRVALLVYDASSLDKLTQSLLEIVRGGIEQVEIAMTAFHPADIALDAAFTGSLPFDVQPADRLRASDFDYLLLFESSGMYHGEDVAGLASYLAAGRLDAVWGSRRLSVRDIQESYRLRYRKNAVLGAVSYVGSHLLSLSCLLFYGRYISDTLSGLRAIRTAYVERIRVSPLHRHANQHLLAALLRDRAEILETPVRFYAMSPDRVRRTSAFEGLRALFALVSLRFVRRRRPFRGAAVPLTHQAGVGPRPGDQAGVGPRP